MQGPNFWIITLTLGSIRMLPLQMSHGEGTWVLLLKGSTEKETAWIPPPTLGWTVTQKMPTHHGAMCERQPVSRFLRFSDICPWYVPVPLSNRIPKCHRSDQSCPQRGTPWSPRLINSQDSHIRVFLLLGQTPQPRQAIALTWRQP